MPHIPHPTKATRFVACLLLLAGLAVAMGGVWLAMLGGSWYYLAAGIAWLATGGLLLRRHRVSLWVFAAYFLATLAWGLWEVGLDWWPLAARLGVPFLMGALLLTPWVRNGLLLCSSAAKLPDNVRPAVDDPAAPTSATQASTTSHTSAHRGAANPPKKTRQPLDSGGVGLALSLALFAAVAVTSWLHDPHRIQGTLPDVARAAPPPAVQDPLPNGEWHAYGRTPFGQRYSPLDQIHAGNVSGLKVAWQYRTGDVRGQPGDPEETTFQVTPLKIGNRLFLCTPHQSVIALDATTGTELWRYDPKIQSELALQHLTCRGLSYRPAEAAQDNANASTPATSAVAAASPGTTPIAGQPVAAQTAPATRADCAAKLYMPTADGRVLALDPDSGAVCTNFGNGTGQIDLWDRMPNVKPGSYYSTSPVVATRNLLIVAGTVLDNVSTQEASGVIRAFDADSGALVWNWDSGNPDNTAPLPAGQQYTPNSPNSWSIASADERLGMVYIPMGNQPPDQWGGNRSEAAERFSSSVVALDLATGQVRWVYQTVRHDLWDYDVPSQPSLVDLTVNGETVPALVQPTKQGDLYVLDRRTGQPILPVREVPAPQGAAEGDYTALTQPKSALSFDPPPLTERDMWGATLFDQLACRIAFRQLRYEGRYTPPSERGSLVYPGNFGVFNWGGISVDPERQIAFTTPTYLAFTSQLVRRKDDTSHYVQDKGSPQGSLPPLNENLGAPFAVKLAPFTSPLGLPCQQPPWGYVAAADLTTGKVVWMHRNGTVRDRAPVPLPFRMGVPNLGGPIMTAGGVAFLSGTLDYYVRGYDVRNGDEIWRSRLPAGGQATPMTYLGEDGRQYLLVVAGGHGSLGTKAGDHVIAYALPGQ